MKFAAAVFATLAAAALAGCGAESSKEAPKTAPPAAATAPAAAPAPAPAAAPAPAPAPAPSPAAPAAETYPLSTCVVSGEKLGEMGDPVVFTYEGTEVHLCCPKCRPLFDKDPKTFLAKIEAAKKK